MHQWILAEYQPGDSIRDFRDLFIPQGCWRSLNEPLKGVRCSLTHRGHKKESNFGGIARNLHKP